MNKLKHFLLDSKNIDKSSFVWNMIGSMLMAFQSVIMLMIITRTLDLYSAGIFTLAYASANLFLNIGKYGMHNFQVSDMKKQFNFKEYLYSRVITTLLMFAFSIIYILISQQKNNYTENKTYVILWMCIFKLIDSVEDVYLAHYQHENRFDISGKIMSLRMGLTIVVFGLCVIFYRDLLSALILTTFFSTLILTFFLRLVQPSFHRSTEQAQPHNIITLLGTCFPLFLGSFLSFYIGNAPKYAIDSQLNDELQACYGFIAMPVFVISLLNNFIFNPLVTKMSFMWKDRQKKEFYHLFRLQILAVIAITFICELGAFFIGVPMLSLLYNTDLTLYKSELLVLLLGGGFLALSGLFANIMTILRIQNNQAIGYGIVAVFAYIFSPLFIKKYSIMGASWLYLTLMILLCIIFGIMLWRFGMQNAD